MKTRLLIMLALLYALPALADELQFYELQHRSAEELIPLLRPLLSPQSGVSGSGNTLILRSQPHELQQINELLPQLDRPLAQLLISVQHEREAQRRQGGVSLHGTLDSPSARLHASQLEQQERHDQQLRVTEGRWASIRSGQAVPQVVHIERHGHRGSLVQQGVEYRDVDSGFEVRPQLSGERVTLEIRPFFARPAASGGGVIEQHSVTTTVSGRLGEWISLSGIDETRRDTGTGTVYATDEQQSQLQGTQLKVDLIE